MENDNLSENICPICTEESMKRYQACPTESDGFCEECWIRTIELWIEKGRIADLFKNQLTCDYCDEPINYKQLPEKVQNYLEQILSTIPKNKTPTQIEDFNYSYNNEGQLRHRDTNEKFIFLGQRHYNSLGLCIDKYIQTEMKKSPWNYEEIWLPLKEEPTDDHHDQVNIFVSDDFKTNENGCLILIQGSGVVRPGQWARSCCINESLDIGAMFPYMKLAKENQLSVIILNPNQTSYIDEEANIASEPDDEDVRAYYLSSEHLPYPPTKKIPELSTNRDHVLYVYDEIIAKKCPAKKLFVVAHSAGGSGLMFLLRKRYQKILPQLSKIAFTDSVHSALPFDEKEITDFLQANALHFVASEKPMGTPIDDRYDFSDGPFFPEVSAGHRKHEYTSGCCVNGVFEFFFPKEEKKDEIHMQKTSL